MIAIQGNYPQKYCHSALSGSLRSIARITKGGKLDDLNMAPDSSPFIDSVTRQDSFDGEDNQPGVEGMEVVGKAVEVATPLGTRYVA